MPEADPILVIAGLSLLTLLAQWLAWRARIPAIVPLLLLGMLAGPLLGVLDARALLGDFLFPAVSVAVAIILFEGSLTLRFRDLEKTSAVLWRLLTLGVIVTWAVVAAAAHLVVGLNLELAVLLGAVMVVTGPTVIGPMLRTVRPRAPIALLLKWEGIIVDPVGAVLAILIFNVLVSGPGDLVTDTLARLARITVVGGASGCLAGYLCGLVLRRYWLPEYLHNAGILLVVVTLFGLTDSLEHEAGLVAVTVMGIWLANMPGVRTDELLEFKETLSVILVSGLFLLLASRLDPASLLGVGLPALALVAIVQFVARPLTILASTWPSELSWADRGLLAWIAPRGIVAAAISALFALRLEEISYPGAGLIVPLAFSVIIGTVLWQGLTTRAVARWLGVAEPEPTGVLLVGANPVALAIAEVLHDAGFPVLLADDSWDNISEARMKGLNTYYGNPTSNHASRNLDLRGIGKVFALSRREESNALACLHFAHELGRDAIYSLSPQLRKDPAEKYSVALQHRGHLLFGAGMSHSKLASLISQGARIRVSKLTDSYGFAELKAESGEITPLFAWESDEALMVNTVEQPLAPRSGMQLAYLDTKGGE